jgi:hypothetical protein
MAHFAKLDENNIVTAVIVVDNAWLDDNGVESEAKGIAALQAWSGHPHWAQTSYNGNIRARYAGIGCQLDRVRDAFIAPQPYPSWVLDEATTTWIAPVPMPEEGFWRWDEETLAWIEFTPPEEATP